MKKVITALANPNVNEKLKKYDKIEVIANDIQYKEGIIELLEEHNQVDFVIISELLQGDIELKDLIEKLKVMDTNIEIIIILEKENKEFENILLAKGNIYIFYNNQVEIKEIAQLIIGKSDTQELEAQIKKLKEMIINNKTIENIQENEKYDISNKDRITIRKQIENEYKEENKKGINNILKKNDKKTNAKVVIVLGIEGIGRSLFVANIANALRYKKKKVLIIDVDFRNSIRILFGKKEAIENLTDEEKKEKKVNETIKRINKRIDLLSIKELLKYMEINDNKVLEIITEFKNKYDAILIDTNISMARKSTLIENVDKIVFLSEANILQIKKSLILLERKIINEKVTKQRVNIIFNKYKKDSIDFSILKEIFKEYSILGKVDFIKNCNTLINENVKGLFLEDKIKKQYRRIATEVLRGEEIKQYYIDKVEDKI